MLKITIPAMEVYDEKNNLFINTEEHTLSLEHSLLSVSKWESKWCKPFMDGKQKTAEENKDYVRCMTLTQNVPQDVYDYIPAESYNEINEYINSPMTATWFNERGPKKTNSEIITSELIYYWMIELNIPFECQKWHLNRLLTLIKVCSIKNTPAKKMPMKEIYASNRALNAARRKAGNHSG